MCSGPDSGHGGEAAVRGEDQGGGGGQGHCQQVQYSAVQYSTVHCVLYSGRGEYWVLVLPGRHTLTAEHTNQWGTLHTQQEVTVTNYLAEGATLQHLVLKPRYIVIGIKIIL